MRPKTTCDRAPPELGYGGHTVQQTCEHALIFVG
jgi:hypothetical protein